MKVTVDVQLSPAELAMSFCAMTDDEQAQFFSGIAAIMDKWPAHARLMQLSFIGQHVNECQCGEGAAGLIADLHAAMSRKAADA
jgi:hypothetical protein